MSYNHQVRLDRQILPSLELQRAQIINQLAADFEQQFQSPFPRLELVAEACFKMSAENAYKARCNGTLPINVYRLGGRNSVKVISTLELAHYVYEQRAKEESL